MRMLIIMDESTHCHSNQDLYALLPQNDLAMEIHSSITFSLSLGKRFRLYPADRESYALSIGFSRTSHYKAAYIKVMGVSLFDTVFNTSVQIMGNVLQLNEKVLISSFPANLECTAETNNDWDSLELEVSGWFDQQGNGNLPKRIEDAVQTKITTKASDAKKRLHQEDLAHTILVNKLDNISNNLTQVEEKLHETQKKYLQAKDNVSEAMLNVLEHQGLVDNATGGLQEAREAVDMLCKIEDCELMCESTSESRIEYVDEFTAINSTCYVQDYKIEEVRVPPFHVQKVTWGFAPACHSSYRCVEITDCQRYASCPVISVPLIAVCPAPDNRINVTVEYLRPATCTEKVFNRTVERFVSYTNLCGTRVADMACLNRNHQCQGKHNKTFHLLEKQEEGLTQPLVLLNQAKNNLTILQNDVVRYELEIESLKSEHAFLTLLLNSAQTQNVSFHRNYDELLESIGTGLSLSKLLEEHNIDEVFSITNMTFSSTVFAGNSDDKTLPLKIYIATVYDSNLPTTVLHYDSTLSHTSKETLINNLATFIFQSIFEAEARKKRLLQGNRHKRQSSLDTEEQFYLQCADLNTALNYLLHLQATLQDKNQYTLQILEEIAELLRALGALNTNATYSLPSANYTLLEKAFNITMEDLEDTDTAIEESPEIEATLEVIEDIKSDAEQMAANVQQNEFVQWQNDMEALQEASRSVGEYECYSFSDCLLIVSETLHSLLQAAPSSLKGELLSSISNAEADLLQLATNDSLSPSQGLDQLSSMLSVAQAMVDMGYWCASLPEFILQPELVVNVSQGETLTLNCEALSTIPLTYVWRKDGVLLQDSNSTTLTRINMQLPDEGNYTCQAQNDIGSVASRRSMVQVYSLPTLTLSPQSVITFVGNENGARFTCNGTGRPTPGWFWQFRHTNGEEWHEVSDHQSNQLLIRQPNRDHEGQYRCVAYNWHGNITSEPVDLQLLEATFRVTTIPVNLYLHRVAADGDDKKRKRSTGDIEEVILNQLNDIFDTGSVTIQGFTISTSVDGEQLLIRFVLVGANVTSQTTSMVLLEEVLPLLIEAQEDLIKLKEELEQYFLTETFILEYNGSTFNNSEDSIRIETVTIVCPRGQQLHEDRIHCGECSSENEEEIGRNYIRMNLFVCCQLSE